MEGEDDRHRDYEWEARRSGEVGESRRPDREGGPGPGRLTHPVVSSGLLDEVVEGPESGGGQCPEGYIGEDPVREDEERRAEHEDRGHTAGQARGRAPTEPDVGR